MTYFMTHGAPLFCLHIPTPMTGCLAHRLFQLQQAMAIHSYVFLSPQKPSVIQENDSFVINHEYSWSFAFSLPLLVIHSKMV
jgi:hypothetical protein